MITIIVFNVLGILKEELEGVAKGDQLVGEGEVILVEHSHIQAPLQLLHMLPHQLFLPTTLLRHQQLLQLLFQDWPLTKWHIFWVFLTHLLLLKNCPVSILLMLICGYLIAALHIIWQEQWIIYLMCLNYHHNLWTFLMGFKPLLLNKEVYASHPDCFFIMSYLLQILNAI